MEQPWDSLFLDFTGDYQNIPASSGTGEKLGSIVHGALPRDYFGCRCKFERRDENKLDSPFHQASLA